MAKIKMEEIVDDLSTEFRRALVLAVREVMPEAQVEEYQLYRAFKRTIGKKCGTWATVKDSHVLY